MRGCTTSTLWCLLQCRLLLETYDSTSESEENRLLLGDHRGVVLDGEDQTEKVCGAKESETRPSWQACPWMGIVALLGVGSCSQSRQGGVVEPCPQ